MRRAGAGAGGTQWFRPSTTSASSAAAVLKLREAPEGRPLDARFRRGFAYADCAADGARLTVVNARSAADLGAAVLVRTAVVRARREEGLWRISLWGRHGERRGVKARGLGHGAG